MADLDRFDLDDRYAGECPMCGESLYWDQETHLVGRERVHKSCYDEAAEELAALDMDWSQSE